MKKIIHKIKVSFSSSPSYVKINIIIIILCFLCISSLTIGYSILTKDLKVNSEITLVGDPSLKITSVGNFSSQNNGYEIYSPSNNKLELSINVGLPQIDSSITYSVDIHNGTNTIMQLKNVINNETNNENIIYELDGLEINQIINKNETISFNITYKYLSSLSSIPSNTTILNMISFIYSEYVEQNTEYITDGMLLKLEGTAPPTNNKWIDMMNNQSMDLNGVTYDNESKSYVFDGQSFASANKPLIPETGDFTLETFIKTPIEFAASYDGAIISQVNDITNDNGRIKLNIKSDAKTNNLLVFVNDQNKNTNLFLYYDKYSKTDTKYLLQLVRIGNNLKLYLNGILINTTSFNSANKISQGPFKLSKWNKGSLQYFYGNIYSVRLYNRALTMEELNNNFKVDQTKYDKLFKIFYLKDYLIEHAISNNTGIYDMGDGKYSFRGNITSNYIKFFNDETNKLYYIVSMDNNSIKLVDISTKESRPFDETGNRNPIASSYCIDSASSPEDTSDYFGCNVFNSQTEIITPISSGNVSNDSTIKKYLDEVYYPSIPIVIKNRLIEKDFDIGMTQSNSTFEEFKTNIKSTTYTGKIGLLSALDVVETNLHINSTMGDNVGINSYLNDLINPSTAYWTINGARDNTYDVWTLVPGKQLSKRRASRVTQLYSNEINTTYYVLPTFHIKNDIKVSGLGTKVSPFIVY